MYKVERTNGPGWYEVMLSPFLNKEKVNEYIAKYSRYYPKEDRIYKITNTESNVSEIFAID